MGYNASRINSVSLRRRHLGGVAGGGKIWESLEGVELVVREGFLMADDKRRLVVDDLNFFDASSDGSSLSRRAVDDETISEMRRRAREIYAVHAVMSLLPILPGNHLILLSARLGGKRKIENTLELADNFGAVFPGQPATEVGTPHERSHDGSFHLTCYFDQRQHVEKRKQAHHQFDHLF